MREEWTTYFMKMAIQASTRATCNRLHVGCILIRDKRIVATGYNGSISGQPHCGDDNHLFIDGKAGCQRVLHAESNAIMQAARQGFPLEGCEAYVTTLPCFDCMKQLVAAGISKVFYFQTYRHGPPDELLLSMIPIEKVEVDSPWIRKVAHDNFWPPDKRATLKDDA